MSSPLYIRTPSLETYVAGDGQRFTELIRDWANVYFPRCGIGSECFSINGVSFRPDGGVDGIVDSPTCDDPLLFLAPKCVFQFKSGRTTKAAAKLEISKKPTDGSPRIFDYLRSNFKLVWIVGKGLPDDHLRTMESDLAEIVEEIQPGLRKPVVIDANRLCQYLSLTPAVACRIAGASGMFVTSEKALLETPHEKLPRFVPGSFFADFRRDVAEFFTNPENPDPIKYIAGEPGIGKSRNVLEAVQATPELAGLVCYFKEPSNVEQFFNCARQEGWKGYCVIDEYIGESESMISINEETIPRGIKAILIGHSYLTNRKSVAITHEMRHLSVDEMVAALQATFVALPEFRIREAIQLSNENIRLARSICSYRTREPNTEFGFAGLERVVEYELGRMTSGKAALGWLSLVPVLFSEHVAEFCTLVGLESAGFQRDCREVSQRSGLIQANTHALYVGAPALAQVALVQLWRTENPSVSRVLESPGRFLEGMLTAIRRLSPCSEKEEMLSFFKMPVASLCLQDLMDPRKGAQLLQLLTADPDSYLPAVHRVVKESVGRLDTYPYESMRPGRIDLIVRLRELAQFEEYFERAEEILFALACEEVRSAYSNTASSCWPEWFGAYFDFTVYPYERRMDLLAKRARSGSLIEKRLVLKAIAAPFPQGGVDIPLERVGGRLAPPESRSIRRSQIEVAADRIPLIVEDLLADCNPEFREAIGDAVAKGYFSWLSVEAVEQYSRIVLSPSFPPSALAGLTARVRRYLHLRSPEDQPYEPWIEHRRRMHQELLQRIDKGDPFLDVLEIAVSGDWGTDQWPDRQELQQRVLERCGQDMAFRSSALEVLSDPANQGGTYFGTLVGPTLEANDLQLILDRVSARGLSQFAYAALRTCVEAHGEFEPLLLAAARAIESEKTATSLTLYRAISDRRYYSEAARILRETPLSSRFFASFWISSVDGVTPEMWQFCVAVFARLEAGDADAVGTALTIAGELARRGVVSEESDRLCLQALAAAVPEIGMGQLNDWGDIGEWLLPRQPEAVILVAASKEQSTLSPATAVLAEAAKNHADGVLRSIAPLLADPYDGRIMHHGALAAIFSVITAEQLRAWLPSQSSNAWRTVAGNLPKPDMRDGVALVPETTRAFWEMCTPRHAAFEESMSNFSSRTFSSGGFFGNGVGLFAERVELAKRLRHDPSEAIRSWAEGHLLMSEKMLFDARKREALDEIRRNIGD